MRTGLADGADGDDLAADVAEACIDDGDDDLFAGEVAHLRAEEGVDALGGVEGGGLELLAGDADSEFEGGGEFGGLGEAEAFFLGEFADGEAAECAHGPVFADEVAADVDGAEALGSGGDEECHELRVVERGGAEEGEFFAWSLLVGHVLNAAVHGG